MVDVVDAEAAVAAAGSAAGVVATAIMEVTVEAVVTAIMECAVEVVVTEPCMRRPPAAVSMCDSLATRFLVT